MMAAFPGHGHGDLAGAYPAVCLGMILHTPGTDEGPTALRAIQPAFERGMVKDLFCADRGISRPSPTTSHLQLLKLASARGEALNDDKVDRQGQFRGMELVGGEFYCPMMPTPLVTAGTTYINSRTDEDRAHALNSIQSRKNFQVKVKEYARRPALTVPGPRTTRHGHLLQPSPAATVHHRRPRRPHCPHPSCSAHHPQAQAGHQHLPRHLHREEHHCPRHRVGQVASRMRLLTPLWQEAWSGLRSQNEGGNSNLCEKSALDSIDNRQFRLPHGRRRADTAQCRDHLRGESQSHRTFFRRDQGIQPRPISTPRTAPQSGQPADTTPVGTTSGRAAQASA
ncbi:hypothetical protein ACW23B_27415 [Streptomyces albidoflavus]